MHPYDRRSHHNYKLNGLLHLPNAAPNLAIAPSYDTAVTKRAMKGQFLQTQSVW